MSKISKKIMVVLALSLVFVMIFAGCSSTKQDAVLGGNASATVTGNGGLVVRQGDYVYYINGLTAVGDIKEDADNTFGNVVKGAIMRGKIDKNGAITDTKVLVPLMCLSSNKNGGINVFGNWVYYTTPSIQKDKNEVMQTSYLEFMRTSLDGTKTENIATVDGNGLQYKFSPYSLIYFAAGKITRIPYSDSKIEKAEVVAEKVSSVILPQNETYVPGKASVDDVIFYTKAAKDDEATYNETYSVGVKAGSKAELIIGGESYLGADKKADKKLQYQITLKDYNLVEGGIELYYEKANPNDAENKAGIFGVLAKDGKIADIKANEVRFTNKTQATFFKAGLDKGIYVFEGGKLTLMKESIDENGISRFEVGKSLKFGGSETIVDFIDYKFAEESVPSVLYMLNSKLYVRALDDDLKLNAKAISEETYGINNSWLGVEIMDGRAYFFNSSYYNYLESMDIATGMMAKNDKDELTHPLANLNAADKKTEQDRIDKEKEEANK